MYVLEVSLKIEKYVCIKGQNAMCDLWLCYRSYAEMAMHTKSKQGHTLTRDPQWTTQET